MISTPIEFLAPAVDVLVPAGTLVITAAPELAPASAAGTSCNCRGAGAAAGASAGAAVPASAVAGAVFVAPGAVAALGFIAPLKSASTLLKTFGGSVGFGAVNAGSPSRPARATSGRRKIIRIAPSCS